jgi:small nuclear ribonucleoprotein (snRNP)-like protein|tara:strand:- start:724 stop:990 length:267 start_codon:yes stop_codon:yes gene_type:complete
MKNVELEKMNDKLPKGRPFDQYKCFFIKDFQNGDSIRLRLKSGKTIRAVVSAIDMDELHIIYKTAESEGNRTTIDKIISLEPYIKNWV